MDTFLSHDELVEKQVREEWSVWSLKGGLQTLIDKLERRLQIDRVDVHTEAPCSHLEFLNEGDTEDGKKVKAG